MARTKRAVLVALGMAIPIEVVNFFVFMPPLDVGIPDDSPWYTKLLGLQWAALHYPGLQVASLIDPYFKAFPVDVFTWFLSGYVDTVLVTLGVVLAVVRIRRLRGGTRSQETA